MDDLNIIEKAKAGNISALNTLLSDSYPILQGYVLKMTANKDITEDIVQETMLKAVFNIKKFIPKAKFSTWLITIATNLYRDFLRKNKNFEIFDETIETKELGPEESLITNIEYLAVKEILFTLPYEKRVVFILKHYYGYKYEEIAEILKCPVGTVRSRLHNSIKYIISEMDRRRLI